MRHASISILLFSSFAFASVEQAYEALNTKTELCAGYKHRTVQSSDEWLINLPLEKMKVALLELNNIAMEKCTLNERRTYSYEIIKEAASFDNMVKVNAWVKFNQASHSTEYTKILNSLPQEQLTRLAQQQEFNKPFDTLKTLNQIKP